MDILDPPHKMFCKCCDWWRRQEEMIQKEAKSAKKGQRGQVEASDTKDFHSSQANGFSNGD